MAPDNDLLRVDGLRVEYLTMRGDICVVDDVSFRIRQGEIFGLAGESGSGKTTVALAILRLLKPPAVITGGRVLFRGQDLLAADEAALRSFRWREASLVTQGAMNALNPVLTVGEQIADVLEVREGTSARAARARVAELLELVGLGGTRPSRHPHELSGGMRQRVVIAMALALNPPLVIMDEPTTALDVVVQKEILTEIAALKQRLGLSILFISHDLSLMMEFCSHVGVMYAGRLVETAPARELLANPRHPYTQGLMKAFPDVHGEPGKLIGIAGSPPDLARPPPGCRFHPRCPRAFDRCRTEVPRPSVAGPDHSSACHLHSP